MPHIKAYLPQAFLPHLGHLGGMADDLDKLINRIAERLVTIGMSERAASVEATGKPDALRYIRTRRAMPGLKRLVQIARTLKTTPDYLLGLSNDPDPTPDQQVTLLAFDLMADSAIEDIENQKRAGVSAENPIFNSSALVVEHFASIDGDDIQAQLYSFKSKFLGFFALPAWMEFRDYSAFICGDGALLPKFKKGDLIVYSTKQPPSKGDYAVFHMRKSSHPEDRPGLAFFVREVLAEDNDSFLVRQHRPSATFRLRKDDLDAVHRVITIEDILTPHGMNAVNID